MYDWNMRVSRGSVWHRFARQWCLNTKNGLSTTSGELHDLRLAAYRGEVRQELDAEVLEFLVPARRHSVGTEDRIDRIDLVHSYVVENDVQAGRSVTALPPSS
jgi:hypothetical protein